MAEVEYKVVGVREVKRLIGAGKISKFYEITIETDRGAVGTVEVPERDYSKSKVKELLQLKASELNMPFEL